MGLHMPGPASQCERSLNVNVVERGCFDEAEDIDAWGVGQNSCGLTGQRRWRGGGFPGRRRRVGPGSVRPVRVLIQWKKNYRIRSYITSYPHGYGGRVMIFFKKTP
jgi:hypothetical protein